MARRSLDAIARERQKLLRILEDNPEGLGRAQLLDRYEQESGKRITVRVLTLRTEELVASGVVKRLGRKNPRYQATVTAEAVGKETADAAPGETHADIPLSAQSRKMLAAIHRPRAQKTPVTYRTEFLDEYEPGVTWYLPTALREELRRLGTTAYADQPAGTYARDIMQRLIIDLSWGSSRLEGNKYSRIDTEELFKSGESAPGASDVDRQMILNHKGAIEFLVENALEIDFNRNTILGLHAYLSENLLGAPDEEGRLRTRAVGIGNSIYTPTGIPQVIEERFDTILSRARQIPDPLEQSFFMMVHIPYLQPFQDVNKRTSRLAANISLIKANLCPLSFVDVPERLYTDGILAVYEQNDVSLLRDVYSWAYRRSCEQFTVLREAMGVPDPIRLNYRLQLRDIVNDVVTEKIWPDDANLLARAYEYGVPDEHRADFVSATRRDLVALRPEKLSRYRLRQSQFDEWLAAIGKDHQRESRDSRG